MPEKNIAQVVATNLAYWMEQAELNQTQLAQRAGVSQKTISNYLNPDQRTEGSKGKPPTPKLAELDLIAKALHIKAWQLLREMNARERAMYDAIERAYTELLSTTEGK